MPKVRTTVTIEESVLRAARVAAARSGRRDSEIIEEALREHLGWNVLDQIWAKADLGEDEAMELALEAQREAREELRRAGA